MNKIGRFLTKCIPFVIFIAILSFLGQGLYAQHESRPTALAGKPVPDFKLTNILSPSSPFTEQNFKGHVTLLSVWATWCYACEMEHPMLMEIKNQYKIPIYAISYRDNPQAVKNFLAERGNPYTIIGNDSTGEVSMDFGVYGTPETYIIDKQARIVYRHVGVISRRTWQNEMLPIIESLK